MSVTTRLVPVIATLALLCAGQARAQSIDYDAAKVVQAMGRVDPKLKIIISHRGSYGHDCPENSECAVYNAVNDGAEAIEIDVKETSDGVPWPSHDITIGRGTNYTLDGKYFDPFRNDSLNEANNPLISKMTSRELQKLKLRDIEGNVTDYNNITLRGLLNWANNKYKNIAFVFDIKYPQSVKKVAQMVKDIGMADRSVLKFSATFFKPLEVYKHTLGVHFAPTLYAPQMDGIAEQNFLQKPDYNDRVYTYMRDFAYVRGFTYYELGNKMFVSSGQSADVTGPMADLTHRLVRDGYPVGNFIPVIEHHADRRSSINGFYHTDGHCCTQLKDFLAKTKHFGNELRDDRPNIADQVHFNENVITDDYKGARNEAIKIGSRQNLRLILQ